MQKSAKKSAKSANIDELSRFHRSVFKLTFVVEVLGLDVWEDFNEGHLELGPCAHGMKIQYQLYPGQSYDLDILIWPHVAKIWCGAQYGWVRTWHFLERRWLTFSISHAFPVRVMDFQQHVATVNLVSGLGGIGTNAKNDKNSEVLLPPLGFGMRRYFAPVLESEEPLWKFIQDLIWEPLEKYIPWSCFDELFDVPHPVSDVRHQDACIDRVREVILNRVQPQHEELVQEEEQPKVRGRKNSKTPKEKIKKPPEKIKFEMKLTGETIMAGNNDNRIRAAIRQQLIYIEKTSKITRCCIYNRSTKSVPPYRARCLIKGKAGTGRVIPFETVGYPPPDTPEIIVLISSNNLPAQDDLPIIFVNIENLFEVPVNELKKLRITQLYIKWQIGEIIHCSELQALNSKTINFNDHRVLPVPYDQFFKMTAEFLDHFVIELRGKKLPTVPREPKLFGYDGKDRDFTRYIPNSTNEELDFPIAVTKINARTLAKGVNSFLRAEFPLYPISVAPKTLEREGYCTNDINSIRAPIVPDLVVKPDLILEAQMCLELSIGVVGCKTRKPSLCYSRMFCTIKTSEAVMEILRKITEINEEILATGKKDDLMTGFVLDTGNVAILYVEGPRDGYILHVWDIAEDFNQDVKPNFSCSDRYSTRIYPELLAAAVPFIIMKMFVPLGVLLACPPTYARPALPLPTRSTVLKIGRLIASECNTFPSRHQMPTAAELKSFRLELCVAPRPTPFVVENKLCTQNQLHTSLQDSRINWYNK